MTFPNPGNEIVSGDLIAIEEDDLIEYKTWTRCSQHFICTSHALAHKRLYRRLLHSEPCDRPARNTRSYRDRFWGSTWAFPMYWASKARSRYLSKRSSPILYLRMRRI